MLRSVPFRCIVAEEIQKATVEGVEWWLPRVLEQTDGFEGIGEGFGEEETWQRMSDRVEEEQGGDEAFGDAAEGAGHATLTREYFDYVVCWVVVGYVW